MTGGPILYVAFDGVLQPLGFSQVARVVREIARRGIRYVLLSVEREADLERREEVERARAFLGQAGVEWSIVATGARNHSARRSVGAMARVSEAARRLVRRHGVALVHARSYQAAAIAFGLRSLFGVPYLFDARGCWIEERAAPGDWFSTPGRYAIGKYVEQSLYRSAEGIVTLTELQATDLRVMLGAGAPPLEVIPTCADYASFALSPFRPAKPASGTAVIEGVRRSLRDKVVLGVIGAINRSYQTEESLRLVRLATEMSSRVHLLVLSKQREEYEALARGEGLRPDRMTIADCTHDQMPEWLQWVDWGVLLLDDTAAKRGSVPTKLAEFFATGVRPLAFGCNSEMTGWIRRAGSGHVLDAIDEPEIRRAAEVVATSTTEQAALARARAVTEPHFGLTGGVDRYERLLQRLVAGS